MKLSELIDLFDVEKLSKFKLALGYKYNLKDMVVFTESVEFGYNMVIRFNTVGEADKMDKDHETKMKLRGVTKIEPRPLRRPNYSITVKVDHLAPELAWETLAKELDDSIQPYLI